MIVIQPLRSQLAILVSVLIVGLVLSLSSQSAACAFQPQVAESEKAADSAAKPHQLRMMTWNIWHGGREDGEDVGPQRVVEVIKESQADIIAMQETYGSGEIISKALGFHFQPRGTNLSIHSRFPIVEDISVFEEFKCVGSLIELPDKRKIAVYCIWLPYGKDIWLPNVRDTATIEELKKACLPSRDDLKQIREAIAKRLSAEKYQGVPIFMAGDFNSMSHLDYSDVTKEQFGDVIDWDTSHEMHDHGFCDSYRECNPVISREKDSTWSPKFPEQEQDRIDFIYYLSDRWRPIKSKVIREHTIKFPSDHAAVLSVFEAKENSPQPPKLNVVSYNIKRGFGNDSKTDINRAAQVLEKLNPDFVGLQEIDLNCKRSGKKNQPQILGAKLGMHAAFGAFMPYQGGDYGMAILSKHPFRNVEAIRLPLGNEPRVALTAEVVLPDNEVITLVNVHFDWVRDDKFRFAQAQKVKQLLDQLETPYILLGDFNDKPGSRTLDLFKKNLVEAEKPSSDHFTFSATDPKMEIDFIFAGPKPSWTTQNTRVIDEPVVSDHRPVISELILSK